MPNDLNLEPTIGPASKREPQPALKPAPQTDCRASLDLLNAGEGQNPLSVLSSVASSPTSFESLQGLAALLSARFEARLAFVSCRRVVPMESAQFPYDAGSGTSAVSRSRLYAQKQALDLQVAAAAVPMWWKPSLTSGLGLRAVSGSEPAAPHADDLLAIPAIGMSCVTLCVVDVMRPTASDRSRSWPEIAWICTNYALEHLRRFPLLGKVAAAILSPQEEKVIQHCREGLTDKEIGKVLGISPHTVRTHLNSAKLKLYARNKTHAVHLYDSSLLLKAE